ncbi:hypothetical protein AGMMS50268_04880 [Spirochaetia bacterium]|nr:hypothetical protein AGMMS50268_04880 [Spirochaetia bacterium]
MVDATDWNDPDNWNVGGSIPGSSDDVFIDSSASVPPILSAPTTIDVNSLTIDTGGVLDLSIYTLNVTGGDVINNADITSTTGGGIETTGNFTSTGSLTGSISIIATDIAISGSSTLSSADLTSNNGNITFTNDAGGGNTLSLTAAATGTGTITITETRALKIDGTGAGLSAGGAVILTAAGITQVKPISAPSVDINSTANVELETSGNAIGSLTATVTGTIKVANNAALTIAGAGITGSSNIDISLTATAGNLLTVSGAVSSASGNISLAADDITITGSVAGGIVNLKADNLTNSGTVTGSTVALDVYTPGNTINILGPGALELDAAVFSGISTTNLIIGSSFTGNLNVAAAFSPAATTLALISGALIAGGNNLITVPNLAVSAAGNVNIAVSVSNDIAVSSGGDITLNSDDPLNIGTVAAVTGLSASGTVTINTITAGSAITLGGSTATALLNSAGLALITANTMKIGDGASGNIIIDGNVAPAVTTLNLTTGGSIVLNTGVITVPNLEVTAAAGDAEIGVNISSSLAVNTSGDVSIHSSGTSAISIAAVSSGGDIKLDSAGGILTISSISGISGMIAAGQIELDVAGSVSAAAQPISCAGLLLLGNGSYDLTNPGNNVTTLAGNAGGAVDFVNSGALILDTLVNSAGNDVDGIEGGAGALELTAGGTGITLNKDMSRTGAITLNSPVTLGTDIEISNAGNIIFGGTVNGTTANTENLKISAGAGTVTFNGIAGGTASLKTLDVTAANTTITENIIAGSGDLDIDSSGTPDGFSVFFSGNVSFQNSSSTGVTAGLGIRFGGDVTGNSRLDLRAGGIAGTGIVSFGGTVNINGAGGIPVRSLFIEADGIILGASLDATGNIFFMVDGNLNLNSVTAPVLQVSTRNPLREIVYGASNLDISNTLEDGTSMTTAIADHAYYNSTAAINVTSFIVGDTAHTGRIYVTAASPAYALSLENNGEIFFNGSYVSSQALGISGGTNVKVILAGGAVGTPREIDLGDEHLTISADIELRGAGSNATAAKITANGGIAITGAINGKAAGQNSITLHAVNTTTPALGTVTVGGAAPATSLGAVRIEHSGLFKTNGAISAGGGFDQDGTADASAQVEIGGNITTIGNSGIVFNKDIEITAHTELRTGDADAAANTGIIQIPGVTGANYNLTLNAEAGAVTINGQIGAAAGRLGAVQINTTGAVDLKGNIYTNNQIITVGGNISLSGVPDPYIFDSDASGVGTSGGDISLGTITGAGKNLTINAGTGVVTLNGSLGAPALIDRLGTVHITGAAVTVTANGAIYPKGVSGSSPELVIAGDTFNAGIISLSQEIKTPPGTFNPESGTILTPIDFAANFSGNYTESGNGVLVGDNPETYIGFNGNVVFASSQPPGIETTGWFVFMGTDKTLGVNGGSGRAIPNVLVFLSANTNKLEMTSGTILQRGDKFIIRQGIVDLGPGSWYMRSSGSSPVAGFEGTDGKLLLGDTLGSGMVQFKSRDFILRSGFNFDASPAVSVPVPPGTAPNNTITVSGTLDISAAASAAQQQFEKIKVIAGNSSNTEIKIGKINGLAVESGSFAKLGSNLVIINDLELYGTLDAVSFDITLGGDWIQTEAFFDDLAHTGTFIPRNKTVYFEATGGVIKIDGVRTEFYNFTCEVPGTTIQFRNYPNLSSGSDPQQGHYIYGKLRIVGSGSSLITLTRLLAADGNPDTSALQESDAQNLPDNAWVMGGPDGLNIVHANKFWNLYYQPDVDNDPAAIMDMEFVKVYWSWARAPLPEKNNVTVTPWIDAARRPPNAGSIPIADSYYNIGWIGTYFIYSFTEDDNKDGRIDRIRIQAYSRIGGPSTISSTDISFTVEGYTVLGYSRPSAYSPSTLSEADFMLYIDLKQNDYPDTGATPRWHMDYNNTLKDKISGGGPFQTLSDWMTPTDTVPPVIGYALALPRQTPAGSGGGVNEIFFRMSEAVNVIPAVTKIMAHADDYAADFPVEAIGEAGGGIIEFRAKAGTPFEIPYLANGGKKFNILPEGSASPGEVVQDLAAKAEYPPRSDRNLGKMAFPLPLYPVDYGDYTSYVTEAGGGKTPGNHNMPDSTAHRVTDLLISVPLQGSEVQPFAAFPILARDTSVDMNPDYPSSIREFDGTRRLRNTDLNFQVMMNKDIAAPGLGLEMIYTAEKNVGEEYKSRSEDNGIEGLWLPGPRNPTAYIVPQPYPQVYTAPGDPDTNNRFIFRIPQGNLTSEATMEFYFRFRGGSPGIPEDMIVTRLGVKNNEAIPDKWWQLIKPFSFKVQDITRQRSGVTILNNVINPNQGEQVFVDYILTRGGRVTIQVFTLDGNLVKVLERSGKDAGEYIASWDGKNNGGRVVARGMYFIRVVAPDIDEIRKVMVVK